MIEQMESRLESKFELFLQNTRSDMRDDSVAMAETFQEQIERKIDAKFAHLLDQSSSNTGSQNSGVSGLST
jgi:kynureninase